MIFILIVLETLCMYYLYPLLSYKIYLTVGFLTTLTIFGFYFYKTVIKDEIIIDTKEDLEDEKKIE